LSALIQLREAAPGLRIDLHVGITTALIRDLKVGSLDLAICRPRGPAIDLIEVPLADEPALIAMPESHRLANVDAVPIEELYNVAFVGASSGTVSTGRIANVPLYERLGFEPPMSGDTAGDPYAMLLLVAASCGVCLVSKGFADQNVFPGVIFRPVDPELKIPLSVVRRARNEDAPLELRKLIEILQANVLCEPW
jgi:DNA-binding transcriptional LysR family regulator